MDEFQHYERFSTDNDFEGGQWIGDEYFYTEQHKGRRQTREQALYGTFADDSDDEEDGRRGRKRRKEDLSKPVAFVSHGVTGSSTDKPADVQRVEHETQHEGTNGLGFAQTGLGFTPAQGVEGGETNGQQEVDIADLPTSFGQRILQKASERQREQHERERRKASEDKRVSRHGMSSGIGMSQGPAFEQYTKGIGSKLMEKMGYVAGRGLGKDQQGIAAALEAKVRPKNMGMGYKDYTEPKLVDEKKEKDKPAQQKAKPKAAEARLWKRNKAAERQRREYRTAEEVLEAQEGKSAAAAQPILDMRGPQARLVTDMEALNAGGEEDAAETIPMPELQHNLRLLVDLSAAEIQRIDGKLRHSKDTAIILKRESERLAGERATLESQVDRLEQVMQRVTLATSAVESSGLEDLQRSYEVLRSSFPEEYVMYNLAAIALTQVLPRMTSLMAGASPLTNPLHGLQQALSWKHLLESAEQANAIFADAEPPSNDPYTALLNATVVPGLASAVTNTWQPREPEPMLAWMDAWREALPMGLQISLLETLVFPKISRAVEEWQPQAESIPVHAWLHPWLPWLGPRLEGLYPTIRFRLSTALQAWHPSDGSALALLSPWHKVFEAKDWEALMVRSILPKLAWALSDALVINPSDQDLSPWHWVTAWAPVLPVHLLIDLLEAHFFPKWHAVLHAWVTHSPNYMEVEQWYLNWKAQLPREIQGHERISAQLSGAMALVEAAIDNRALPAYNHAPGRDAYAAAASAAVPQGPSASRWGGATIAQTPSEPTLRQMVEVYAEQNNLDFVPKAGRREQGLQVYGFGLVSVTLDNTHNTIKAQMKDGIWKPTTLEELVEESARRLASKKA